jgi:hypothetical protein
VWLMFRNGESILYSWSYHDVRIFLMLRCAIDIGPGLIFSSNS